MQTQKFELPTKPDLLSMIIPKFFYSLWTMSTGTQYSAEALQQETDTYRKRKSMFFLGWLITAPLVSTVPIMVMDFNEHRIGVAKILFHLLFAISAMLCILYNDFLISFRFKAESKVAQLFLSDFHKLRRLVPIREHDFNSINLNLRNYFSQNTHTSSYPREWICNYACLCWLRLREIGVRINALTVLEQSNDPTHAHASKDKEKLIRKLNKRVALMRKFNLFPPDCPVEELCLNATGPGGIW